MIDYQEWYNNKKEAYSSLMRVIRPLLDLLVTNEGIHHLPIQARIKEYDSFIAKKHRKEIDNPEDITDLLGLRVICYILSDVEKVKEIVEKYFKVIGRADDKTQDLGTDRFGYRSVHYTVSISEARHNLPEYESYKDLKFEIQIRTILAHAWAEIEHDRNYKLDSELPPDLKRKFSNLAAR